MYSNLSEQELLELSVKINNKLSDIKLQKAKKIIDDLEQELQSMKRDINNLEQSIHHLFRETEKIEHLLNKDETIEIK